MSHQSQKKNSLNPEGSEGINFIYSKAVENALDKFPTDDVKPPEEAKSIRKKQKKNNNNDKVIVYKLKTIFDEREEFRQLNEQNDMTEPV